MKVLTTIVVLILATSTASLAFDQDKDKDKSEPIFHVFLEEPEDEPEDKESRIKATEEVKKSVKERSKWFEVVENPLEAYVIVQVLGAWDEKDRPKFLDRQKFPQEQSGYQVPPPQPGPKDTHFLEFRYRIKGDWGGTVTVAGQSLERAAEDAARQLHTLCDAYDFATGEKHD
jgi:hypothetical protein